MLYANNGTKCMYKGIDLPYKRVESKFFAVFPLEVTKTSFATNRLPECLKFSDRFVFSVMLWFEKRAVSEREEARQNRSVLDQEKAK